MSKRSKEPRLFHHFVGAGEERIRHGQAERFGGLEIDSELELASNLAYPRSARFASHSDQTADMLRGLFRVMGLEALHRFSGDVIFRKAFPALRSGALRIRGLPRGHRRVLCRQRGTPRGQCGERGIPTRNLGKCHHR